MTSEPLRHYLAKELSDKAGSLVGVEDSSFASNPHNFDLVGVPLDISLEYIGGVVGRHHNLSPESQQIYANGDYQATFRSGRGGQTSSVSIRRNGARVSVGLRRD